MKKLDIKSEKGAVTLLVLVTILFMLTTLTSMYISASSKVQIQIEMTREIRRIYGAEKAEDVYNSFFTNNVFSTYTEELFLENGAYMPMAIDEFNMENEYEYVNLLPESKQEEAEIVPSD